MAYAAGILGGSGAGVGVNIPCKKQEKEESGLVWALVLLSGDRLEGSLERSTEHQGTTTANVVLCREVTLFQEESKK